MDITLFQDAENAIKVMHGECILWCVRVEMAVVMILVSTFQARCSVAGPSEPTGPPERDHKVSWPEESHFIYPSLWYESSVNPVSRHLEYNCWG